MVDNENNILKGPDAFFQARLRCIVIAAKESFDVNNPNKQTPQWLREGVNIINSGGTITEEILNKIDNMGGTHLP